MQVKDSQLSSPVFLLHQKEISFFPSKCTFFPPLGIKEEEKKNKK